jgi:katanin p80 WD40 repeat-containing subunit B1
MPIVNSKFYKDNYLITSATDSLKVWNIKKGCSLLDNIESSCRGVIDLHVSDVQTQQIAFSNNILSLHVCQLSSISLTDRSP